jgi:hypothetical protein
MPPRLPSLARAFPRSTHLPEVPHSSRGLTRPEQHWSPRLARVVRSYTPHRTNARRYRWQYLPHCDAGFSLTSLLCIEVKASALRTPL